MMFTKEEMQFMIAVMIQLQWRVDQAKEFKIAAAIVEKLKRAVEEIPE